MDAGERPPGRLPAWTVRSRILAAILVVAALGLGVAGFVTYLVQRETVAAEVDATLRSQLDAARRVLDSQDVAPASAADALAEVLEVVVPPPQGSTLGIIDGRAALVSGVTVPFRLDDIEGFVDRVVAEVADGTVRRGSVVDGDGHEIRYLAAPVEVEGVDDAGVFVTGISLTDTMEPVDRAFAVYLVVAAVVLVAIGVVGWTVAGRLLRPIRRLRRTARRITAHDLDERIAVTGDDDVSALAHTVNDMLDRLQSALRGQRDLLADVRHELRTPLTVIRGHLEVLDGRDPADVEATRALVIDEVGRMTALVDGLVALAEVRLTDPVLRQVDVAELTRLLAARVEVIPGHEWRVSATADGTAELDRDRILQAWLQLADNAAKYSPEGAPIELGSSALGDDVEFWVQDRGDGVPPGTEEAIFGRRIRGAVVDQRGSGLGLAIVADIARSHGGRVTVVSDGGARFGIVVPREPSVLEEGKSDT
jgi:signal transduction histidine kinase